MFAFNFNFDTLGSQKPQLDSSSPFNEVANQLKKLQGSVPNEFFTTFPSSYKDIQGHNLFSIYLTQGCSHHYVDKFLDLGYSLNSDLIDCHSWDILFESLLLRQDVKDVVNRLFENSTPNIGYYVLTLPSRFKFDIFNAVYEKGQIYSDHRHILQDMFEGKIDFFVNTETKKWKETMNKMVKCLRFLIKEECLKKEDLNYLFDPTFEEKFKHNIFYFCELVYQSKPINTGGNAVQAALASGKSGMGAIGSASGSMQALLHNQTQNANGVMIGPTPEDQLTLFLKNLRATLNKDYMDLMLETKPETEETYTSKRKI